MILKKQIIYCLLFIMLTNSFLNAQSKIYGEVSYLYIAHPRKCALEYDAKLLLSENSSLFIWGKGDIERLNCNNGVDAKLQDKYGNQIYKDYQTKKLKIREIIITSPYVTEELQPVFNWDIKDEFKTLGGFKVQKATTTFRGRFYTAWFTTKIPINNGPWKFSGLPGLILEAYDQNKEYSFSVTKIDLNKKKQDTWFTNKGKKLPFEKFIKARDFEHKELEKRSRADSGIEIEYKRNPSNPIEIEYN